MPSNKRFPVITDQALAELRQRIGKKLEKQVIWINACSGGNPCAASSTMRAR